jgi:hypothetical protein
MHRLYVLLAGWVLCAGIATAGETSCRNNWTDIRHTDPGIVLTTGIESFQRDQPAPNELLEKIGPLLCASGTEELRVADVADRSGFGDPARQAERHIRLVEFIRGREVRLSFVGISLNIETNEVKGVNAQFLPNRDVDREPRLSAAEARAKVETAMRKDRYVEVANSGQRVQIALYETPAPYLAYEIEQYGFAPPRGVLVWVFSAQEVQNRQPYEVSVDAATGKVISFQGMLYAVHRPN